MEIVDQGGRLVGNLVLSSFPICNSINTLSTILFFIFFELLLVPITFCLGHRIICYCY